MEVIYWSEDNLEKIADAIAEKNFCVIDNFMSPADTDELRKVIEGHLRKDLFKKAGIGNMHLFQVDRDIRGDKIKWIDRNDAHPATLIFLDQIELLVNALNRLLYLSLKDYECHFALYPPGTFYEKHLDQFKSSNQRKISFAFYLNKNWKAEDQGELRIFEPDNFTDIQPFDGRIVVFRSDVVEHEVLKTNADRYSITGWLRDQPVDLPFV